MLTITDGGFGDLDGIANGIIIDPSGLGTPSGSGGGENVVGALDDLVGDTVDSLSSVAGCFIGTAAQPPQSLRPVNSRSGSDGCLLANALLLLTAAAVGRKLKSLTSFNQRTQLLAAGCLILKRPAISPGPSIRRPIRQFHTP